MEENKDNDIIYDLEHADMESGRSDRWLEGPVTDAECGIAEDKEVAGNSENCENSGSSGNSENSENSESSENCENTVALAPDGAQTDCACGAAVKMTALHNEADPDCASGAAVRMTAPHEMSGLHEMSAHHEEIERMVKEMGAETLLEIIRDNRNAAIRQIISEVEASQIRTPPSGASCTAPCSSIFDLAALA